ncbi:MAG: 50S ribosomal protein L9 [bacterium]
MKLILLSDIERLGKRGEVVDVRNGFARNYLLPRKLAIVADEANTRQLENIRRAIDNRSTRLTKRLMTLSEQLGLLALKTKIKMGTEGAFGAITNADVAALLEKAGHKIDKHAIVLEEPIKTPGIYNIPVKLGPEITANVKLWVAEESVS